MGESDDKSLFNLDDQLNKASVRQVNDTESTSLLDSRPFLQILHCDAQAKEVFILKDSVQDDSLDSALYGVPTYIGTNFKWNIQYWPGSEGGASSISASPGSQVFYGNQPVFEEEDYAVGTLTSQSVEIAAFIVCLAKQQGWRGIKIQRGQKQMIWAAWMVASYFSIPLFGFSPNEQDQQKRDKALPVIQDLLDMPLMYEVSSEYLYDASPSNGDKLAILKSDIDFD